MLTQMIKICSKCKIEKYIDEFSKDKTHKDGYQSICKNCQKEYHKTYKQKYSSKKNENHKRWIKKNPNKAKEYSKKYRESHIEQCKERRKQYYQKNKEKYQQYQKNRYQENPEKIKEQRKQYYKNNVQKTKNSNLLLNYGITIEEYNSIFIKQKGKCAICGRQRSEFKKDFAVDHDHKTKKIRGLLCNNCNRGIGFLKDCVEIVFKAYKYLQKSV